MLQARAKCPWHCPFNTHSGQTVLTFLFNIVQHCSYVEHVSPPCWMMLRDFKKCCTSKVWLPSNFCPKKLYSATLDDVESIWLRHEDTQPFCLGCARGVGRLNKRMNEWLQRYICAVYDFAVKAHPSKTSGIQKQNWR